jgi:hypothetical protein
LIERFSEFTGQYLSAPFFIAVAIRVELDTERHRDGCRPAGGPVRGDAWRRVFFDLLKRV